MPRHSGATRKASKAARHRAAQRSVDRQRRKQDKTDKSNATTASTPDIGTRTADHYSKPFTDNHSA